ncbi:MAG: O-antigen ligase family protein [Mollicutes bacterium]|jgi:hypothetical protein|nr:O-antigen ligase family protein [Mollicutes bacterium]
MTKIKEYWQTFLSLGIMACIALPIFLLFEQTYAPNNLWIRPFEFAAFTFLSAIIISFLNLYIYFFSKPLKNSRFACVGAVAVGLFIIIGIANVLSSKSFETVNLTLNNGSVASLEIVRSTMDKYKSIVLLIINFVFIYILVFNVTLKKNFKNMMVLLAHLYLLFIIAIIIFSLITEYEVYQKILATGLNDTSDVPDSAFDNRNTFASFLLTGIIYSFYLYFNAGDKKRRYIYSAFSLIPALFIYFTYSKTNIIFVILIYSAVLLRHYIRNIIRKRWVLFGIETLLLVSFLVLFIPFRYVPSLKILPPSVFLFKVIPAKFVFLGKKSIDNRFDLLKIAINTIKTSPRSFWFGEGIYISRKVYHASLNLNEFIYPSTGFGNYHNGFAEVFHSFGLIGFLIYCFCILYLIVGIIRLFFYKKNIAFFLIINFCVFFGSAMLESQAMLLFKTDPIFASIPLVLLTVYYVNKYKCSLFHPLKKKAAKAA